MKTLSVSITVDGVTATISERHDDLVPGTSFRSDRDLVVDAVERTIVAIGFVLPREELSASGENRLVEAMERLEPYVHVEDARGFEDYVTDTVEYIAKLEKRVKSLDNAVLNFQQGHLAEEQSKEGTFAWAAEMLMAGRSVRRPLQVFGNWQVLKPDQQNDVIGAEDFTATNWEVVK